jgi:hypothetical protein
MQQLKLPRLVTNFDSRNWPKDSEMSNGWDWVRPRAVLGLRDYEKTRTICGQKYLCREVQSGLGNCCEETPLPDLTKTLPVTIIAHAHVADGCNFPARDEAWQTMLSPADDVRALRAMGMTIHGKGWEHFSGYDAGYMLRMVPPQEALRLLASAKTCPVVPAADGYYTNKFRRLLTQGCLPLFYGRGAPHTADPQGKYVRLDSWMRITKPGDLLTLVKFWDSHEEDRQAEIIRLQSLMAPDWSVFDNMLTEALRGADYDNWAWFEKFGGYRRL